MSKTYTLKDEVYLVLVKYFKGSITRLNKSDLDDLINNTYKKKDIRPIKPELLKELKKILKARDKYDIDFIFPKWSKDKIIIKEKLKEIFPKENKLKVADPKPIADWADIKEDTIDEEPVKPVKKVEKKPNKDAKDITYIAEHIEWSDNLIFYPNKNFKRVKRHGETGKWILKDNILTLNWTKWEPEVFHTEDNGQTFIDDKGSTLTLRKLTIIPKWFKLPIKEPVKESKEPVKESVKEPIKDKKPDNVLEYNKDYKYVLSQRKAYVDFINTDFYDKLMEDVDASMFKNYQKFVRGYLSLESPYRGLLVYHGLGTGKTATSIITTEGLSNMRINTLLPKSLKDNYINEIKDNRFTGDTYDINNNNWFFFTMEEIQSNQSVLDYIKKSNLSRAFISNVIKSTRAEIKSLYKDKYKTLIKEIVNGIFIKIEDVYIKDKEIFTVSGILVPNKLLKSYDNVNTLSEIQLIQLNKQIHELVLNKYNFIHSNALPRITEKQLKEIGINNDDLANKILNKNADKKPTDRQEIMNELIEKYIKNKKKNILSPFHNEVIVIDEVHNLISQITNGRGPSVVFYDWIVESVNTKIVFLSGTPIINSPSEIAYLFNMLKGKLHVYDFVIKMTGDIDEITNKLKEIFYSKISCIEQLNVKKYKGKIIISFIKTRSNFANILDDDIVKTIRYNDYSFDEFMKQIYIGLHKFTDDKLIYPSQKEFKHISKKDKNAMINGKETIFDEETGVIFNKNHKLFELYDDNQTKIDLTNNENFMEYFFDDKYDIQPRKKVLLRRMLMGLISYYPIDRSAISYMPEIKEPHIDIPLYKNHSITKKINLVPCYMSLEQYNQYEIAYNKEVESDLKKVSKKNMYEDEFFHYYSATRQTCNIAYSEPDLKGEESYNVMKQNNNFSENLSLYSPKMYEIMKNIGRFIEADKPTGKVLLYSVYKSDGGSGGFEQVLKAHGYEKYDYKSENIDKLIKTNNKKKRYTFITGDEDEIDKEENKIAYNNIENINGEYIQVMIISQSGAEGISLTCVRQVHILEPYWNNVRMDQVFGRAIRRNSHIGPDTNNPWLPKSKQNVEQYLYLCLFPDGNNTKDIFKSIKELKWTIANDIEYIDDDFEQYLLNEHKSVYILIQNILNIKLSSRPESTDEMLFNIMERKYNINEKLNDIIKESSVDCIKHTTDDPILNNKCVQFSEKLQNEMAYFPGIDSDELNKIDNKQLISTFSYFIKPDTIVVSSTTSKEQIYSYYKINPRYKDEDARYIKENGDLLCDFYSFQNKFFVYENSKYHLNSKITNKFSVVQSIYNLPPEDEIYNEQISKWEFPRLDKIKLDKYLVGYKIKYNINDKLFFMPLNNHDLDIYKLYDYKTYLDNKYSLTENEKYIIIHYNNNFYESI